MDPSLNPTHKRRRSSSSSNCLAEFHENPKRSRTLPFRMTNSPPSSQNQLQQQAPTYLPFPQTNVIPQFAIPYSNVPESSSFSTASSRFSGTSASSSHSSSGQSNVYADSSDHPTAESSFSTSYSPWQTTTVEYAQIQISESTEDMDMMQSPTRTTWQEEVESLQANEQERRNMPPSSFARPLPPSSHRVVPLEVNAGLMSPKNPSNGRIPTPRYGGGFFSDTPQLHTLTINPLITSASSSSSSSSPYTGGTSPSNHSNYSASTATTANPNAQDASPSSATQYTSYTSDFLKKKQEDRLPSPISEDGFFAAEPLTPDLRAAHHGTYPKIVMSLYPDDEEAHMSGVAGGSGAVDIDTDMAMDMSMDMDMDRVPEMDLEVERPRSRSRSGAISEHFYDGSNTQSPIKLGFGPAGAAGPGFAMGYRANCEKCRMRVPGHYSHILRS